MKRFSVSSFQFSESYLNKNRAKKGFTFTELAISVAVLAILAGVAAPVISQGIDAILLSRNKEQILQEARVSLQWMASELRDRCTAITTFSTSNRRYIRFTSNSTFDPCVEYEWLPGSANLELRRRAYDASCSALSYDSILATGVELFQIKCLPATTGTSMYMQDAYTTLNDIDLLSPSPPGPIKIIQILLRVSNPATNSRIDLITRIKPRNFPSP